MGVLDDSTIDGDAQLGSTSGDSLSSLSSGSGLQSQGQVLAATKVQAAPADGSSGPQSQGHVGSTSGDSLSSLSSGSGQQSQDQVQAATKVQAACFVLFVISVIVGEIVYCNPDDADCVMPAYACAALIGVFPVLYIAVEVVKCLRRDEASLRTKLNGLYKACGVYNEQDEVISDEDRQKVVEKIIEELKNKSTGSSELSDLSDLSELSELIDNCSNYSDKKIEERVKVLLDSGSSSQQPSSCTNDEGQRYEILEEGSHNVYIDSLIKTIQRKNTISTLLDSPRGCVSVGLRA